MKKSILRFPDDMTPRARSAFRVSAIITVLAIFVVPAYVFLGIQTGAWQMWVEIGIAAGILLATLIGGRLVWRGQVDRGVQISMYTLILGITATSYLFENMGIFLGVTCVVLTIALAAQLLDRPLPLIVAGFAGGIVAALADVLLLSYRLSIPVLQSMLLPIAGVTIAVFGFLGLRSYKRYSLRTKFLLGILLTTGLSVAIFGFFTYIRTQKTQAFLTAELENTVRQQSEQQLNATAQSQALIADQTLSTVANEVNQLAEHQASLFDQQSILGEGAYWDAHTKVFEMSAGQHGNSANDVASIFVPNAFTLTETMISDLNTGAYLDFVAPGVLHSNPDIVAIYFNSASGFSIYYPNINLAANVPPDFDILAQSFYTIATPEEDPGRELVWTDPYQDPAGTGLIVSSSAPVYDRNGRFRGVLSADIQLSKIAEHIAAIKIGQTGFAFLVDSSGHIIAMPDMGYKFFDLQEEIVPVNESPKETVLGHGPTDLQEATHRMTSANQGLTTVVVQNTQYYFAYAPMPSVGYSIGLIVPVAELDSPFLAARDRIATLTRTTVSLAVILLIVILVSVAGASFFLSQIISRPLVELTHVAEKISAGNLNLQAFVTSEDETGRLAKTFNNMTGQLRDLIGSLEQRVADRTRNLELAAEVGRSVSQVHDLQIMLKDACELIQKEFSLYYVQVYLTDPSQTTLRLEAGTGEVGSQLLATGHNLPLDTGSINGRAAVEKRTVVISDTAESATFRTNPLLPDTRGEMAVPLIVAEQVVGVLDMQSSHPGTLTEEELPAFEALAGQLAVAIQNANLLAEAEQVRAEVESQARRLARSGWDEYLDAVHKPEQIGFAFARNEITQLTESDESQPPEESRVVSALISLAGEALGSLVVEVDERNQNEQTGELVDIVARQVAQQIENLRLLETAERYRFEAEQAARKQTIEGWQEYINSRPQGSLGYLYDLKEVLPYSNGHDDESALTLPLKARDEKVGKLSVQGLAPDDQESYGLASAVAERLGAHIENLRLFEETRRGQFELDRRAKQLAAVAQVSTASSQELDIRKMLATVVQLTQRQFGLYHAHVFLYDGSTQELEIAACGWKDGDEYEGTHGETSIPVSQEQSLVARAVRTRHAVIVNDVHNEPGWLPNPLLPDTASEIAVPLMVGEQILGVLDVQSDRTNAFTEEDANIQMTLASQVAIALQNAYSFAQAQKQAEREAMLNTINQKIQSATSVEAVLQIAARELGHALGAPMTIAQLSMKDQK